MRWYEIDPTSTTPVMLRQGEVGSASVSLFNGAISPDRRVDGATALFGDSFVLQVNQSGATTFPRIVAYSSVAGGALSAVSIKSGAGPYFDVSCPDASGICIWGGASAAPDPRSPAGAKNVVWGSNQYSGVLSPPTTGLNYRTWNFAVTP